MISKLTARGVGCDTARAIARAWERRCTSQGPNDHFCRVRHGSWACRDSDGGYEAVVVRCRRGERLVRFRWGS